MVHPLLYNKENVGFGNRLAMSQNDNEKDDVFLILTGLGGSAEGFGNKYGHICDFVQKDYGFSTFVVQTPQDVWERKDAFFEEVAANYIQNRRRVYIMGVSAGASLALWYAACYSQIRRVLCVNPVLNLNLHLTVAGVRNFCGERMTIVLGEKDPSAKWTKVMPQRENVQTYIFPAADHVFSGMLDEFIVLPKRFLFE